MPLHEINGYKIETIYEYPPIPVRHLDWVAILADEDYEPGHNLPWARGATEQEAINDLLEILKELEA